MEDLDVIFGFIAESDFGDKIKQALKESLMIEAKGGLISEYANLLKHLSKEELNED